MTDDAEDGNVLQRLQAAKDEVARLEREIAQTHCKISGHDWQHLGGAWCGCSETAICSIPVHECTKCDARRFGDCDYGRNVWAAEKRKRCAEEQDHG